MLTIQGPHYPIIAVLGGVTYAISGTTWLPVPPETTLADLTYDERDLPPTEPLRTLTRTVPSGRDPSKTYAVAVRSDGAQSCTCSGFMYRRTCRHVVALMKELNA